MTELIHVFEVVPDASNCERFEVPQRAGTRSDDGPVVASGTASNQESIPELVPDGGVEEFPDEDERDSVTLSESAISGDDSTTSGDGPVVSDGGVEGEYFRALADTLSDAILVIDADSIVQFANPAVEKIFGYSPDQLIGSSLTELMSPELADRYRAGVERYLRDGERHLDWNYIELIGHHRDGHEVPLAVSFSEFTSDGEQYFTGIAWDISDRKLREAELRDRMEQRDALTTFSRHALEDRPLADLMNDAVELVADVLDHEYAGVLEYRPEEDDLLVRAVSGWPEEVVGEATLGTERHSQAGYTLLADEPVVAESLDADERFDSDELLDSTDVTSGVSTVVGSTANPWGVLGVHDGDVQSYTDYDVQFVQGVGHVLATAIERRKRKRRLEQYETMLNAVGDGVYALDGDSRFVAVNDAYVELTGYPRAELLGEPASKVHDDELTETERVEEALGEGRNVVTIAGTVTPADDESIPVETRIAPLQWDGVTGRVGVVRDVSDRERREEKLTSLNERFESLADAESTTETCDIAVDAAVEILGFQNAAVALYDDEAGSLVSTVRRWADGEIDDALLGRPGSDAAWQAFVEGETHVIDDLDAELDAETRMGSALVIPLGKYGVFLTAAPESEAFDRTDQSLADMLCSNVRSALDRADREETLRRQRNQLREKNRELERVNRLNRVMRELTKALTRASSRDDVLRAVCERLAETGPYRFVWFADHDRATNDLHPEASAGVEEGYLEEVVVKADESDSRGQGPSGRAVRTREVQVQNDLLGDPPFEPWREKALKRGYRSSAAVPVIYDGTLRGVLNLYADAPDVFDETETEVLSELGAFIGYALNALEQKQALVSERSIELDFRIRGADTPVLAFVTETDAEFEFENVVQRADGRLHAFFTVRGSSPEESIAFAEEVSFIENVHLVAEREDEYLYECTLGGQSFVQQLVGRGAMLRSLTAAGGEGRFVVRIPQSANVRTFVELFEDYYENVELVARREVDEPVMTSQQFESELADRLTDRQVEVLRMAYFRGFFEWPRESTAEEIAEALDVSQPTVSRHIRAAERVLFELLFEER
jgi:PAS domain S-box-containing protein